MAKPIRVGQLITPFGPGSLYTDTKGSPNIVAGLDYWLPVDNQKNEFLISEPRLTDLLNVDALYRAPDFRRPLRGQMHPPNANLKIPALRFPRWHRNTKTGVLKLFNLEKVRFDQPKKGNGRWVPVRFVSACAAGHLNEFPWKEWCGCTCQGNGSERLILKDNGGAQLSSITVSCPDCGKHRNLSGATVRPAGEGYENEETEMKKCCSCQGQRPWLGDIEGGNCGQPLVGVLINQSNLYFPKTISAIALPDLRIEEPDAAIVRTKIEEDPVTEMKARIIWKSGDKELAILAVQKGLSLKDSYIEFIKSALNSLYEKKENFGGFEIKVPEKAENAFLTMRRQEFNVLRLENGLTDEKASPFLRILPTQILDSLNDRISLVRLVERLRETRAFCGFDRLEPTSIKLSDMPDVALNQLFRNRPQEGERWLPAVSVFGEGIYFELSSEGVNQWFDNNNKWLSNRLRNEFIQRLGMIETTLPPSTGPSLFWAARYLLLHSLTHILINQLVFECGYSTAALRERLYVSVDPAAPMLGALIYTAAGDSEGTLGGLVRMGEPHAFSSLVQRAVTRAAWCSADPVCSEGLGGTGSKRANLAACHACTLLPETSCETINHGLDRAMVVGTPQNREVGFMSSFLSATAPELL